MTYLLALLLFCVQAPAPGTGADEPKVLEPPAQAPAATDEPKVLEPPGPAPGGAAPVDNNSAPAPNPNAAPNPLEQPQFQFEPPRLQDWQTWALIFGEPGDTVLTSWGPVLSWIKIVGILSLLGWVGSWVFYSLRDRPPASFTIGGARPLDFIAVVAVLIGLASIFIRVLQLRERLPQANISGVPFASILGIAALGVVFFWLDSLLWKGIRRAGTKFDSLVLVAIHIALLAGIGIGFTMPAAMALLMNNVGQDTLQRVLQQRGSAWDQKLILGSRLGFTFMGYVVLLRIAGMVFSELIRVRFRRLYAIGKLSWIESFRKTRIPWAVLGIFLVILAFTHWFLQPPDALRQAELSRMYVGTLMLLCSLLVTLMVAILTPITLPNDIRFNTIYTVVTKPVRRLEVVLGRVLGFMAVVTLILGFFWLVDWAYLASNVSSRISDLERQIAAARNEGRTDQADQLQGQLEQLQARYSARVPVGGSLIFYDSFGKPDLKGIDVGQELELRSHIEGATQSKALWRFGVVRDPVDELYPDPNRPPRPLLNRVIPTQELLREGTVEWLANRVADDRAQIDRLRAQSNTPNFPASQLTQINAEVARLEAEIASNQKQLEALQKQVADLSARATAARTKVDELSTRAQQAESSGQADQASAARSELATSTAELTELERQLNAVRSNPVPVQMTFTVYRTTKGRLGEPVVASIKATNPYTNASTSDTFPIREYYTNTWSFPAELLVGSQGALNIEVQCISPTQYLGMSEGDLFLVTQSGSIYTNLFKGLVGVWVKAMVLTAIGVFAGTFLSWPVALLTTVFFFLAGEIFFPILRDLAMNATVGGGPFESLIRMINHENQMNTLDATPGVVIAQSLDSIVVPLISRLVYIVPNFSAMDLSNAVADGFAIDIWSLLGIMLLGLAYAVPFIIAGYFILKNREVAA